MSADRPVSEGVAQPLSVLAQPANAASAAMASVLRSVNPCVMRCLLMFLWLAVYA
jgi:hypothetical protein